MPLTVQVLTSGLKKRLTINVFCALFFSAFISPIFSQPLITSFSPASGPIGTPVTITGSNFSTTPANNIVYFGAVKATVTAASATSLTVTVPSGTTYQPVTVTVSGLTAYSQRPFQVTFSGGGTINGNAFGAIQDFTTGIRPNAIAIADFDGDGKADVATPNNHSSGGLASVSVLRNISNTGTIDFAPKQDMVTGGVTYCIGAGDIDGDGKPDIVAGSIEAAVVSVFRNTSTTGNISFAPKVDFTITGAPYDIAIKDFDGDGKTDLAVLDNGILFQGLSVFRNTGSTGVIAFAPKVDFTTQLSPKSIVATDLDGDGKTDIAFTNQTSNSFSVYRNTGSSGTISFAPRVDITCGSGNQPFSITTGDLDNDAKTDVIVVINNNTGGGAQLFRNTGSPGAVSFTFNTSLASGASSNTCYHAGVNDINGDGKPDIAMTVAGSSSGQSQLYQNNTTGSSFSFGTANNIFSAFAPYGIGFSDFEGDGRPDLVISEFTMEKISAYKNQSGAPNVTSFNPTAAGAGANITITGNNFTNITSVKFGGVTAATFGTVNSTTINATVASGGATGAVEVTNNVGTGSLAGFIFNAPPVINSFSPTSAGNGATVTITGVNFNGTTSVSFGGVAAASFTIVNSTTITAIVANGASGSVSVTNGFGSVSLPGFTYLAPSITSFAPTAGGAGATINITGNNLTGATSVSFGATAAASFIVNSATSISAVLAGGSTGDVRVVTTSGTASLSGFTFISPPPPVVTSVTPSSGFVGSSVLINGTNFGGSPSANIVYFGATKATVNAATSSQLNVTVPAGSTFEPLSVLNASNGLSGTSINPFIATFPNGGVINQSSFQLRTDVNIGPFAFPYDTEISDIDGDGKPDVIYTYADGIHILLNTSTVSTISFSSSFTAPGFAANAQRVSIGDIDGDGKPDLIGLSGSGVIVARNTSAPGFLSFASPVTVLAANVSGQKIGIDDVNDDGKPDLVIPFSGNLILSVLRNVSTPGVISMAPPINIATLGGGETACIADMDGDGKKDLIIGYEGFSANLSVLRNTSAGGVISFATRQDFSTLSNQGFLSICDIDNDNKKDIILTNVANSYSIFKNNSTTGLITFQPRIDQTLASAAFAKEVIAGDVDGDSKPDIIAAKDGAASISIQKNNSTPGTINLLPEVDYYSGVASSISLADMNGDSRPDIIGAYGSWHFISVLKNDVNTPAVTSFTPTNGTSGTVVTITGNNFTGATAVSFGGVAAQSFVVNSSTTITATVGNGASGIVSVTTPAGIATRSGFNYYSIPTVTSFTPVSGTTGTSITITGTNFGGATLVSFGGVAAQSYVVNSATTITAVVGAGASGNVAVGNPIGNGSLAGFTFITPPPTISTIAPGIGVAGTPVTITGTNFIGVSAVAFGGVSASSFVVNSASSITAIVGTTASGNVTVTTPSGTATYGGFTIMPTPTMTSFSPSTGGTGTIMTITGTNFTFLQNVRIGGVPIASLVSSSPTLLTVTVGTGASGSVEVITQGGGLASLPGFVFIAAPIISSFTPTTAGSNATVTITGSNFTGATAVSFGGVQATSFTVVNATTITAVVGTGASGNVSVTTPGGTATRAGFIYNPVTAVTPPIAVNTPELTANPNPGNALITIRHPSSTKESSIRFVDVIGKTVKQIDIPRSRTQTVTDVSSLSAGIYYIIWEDDKRRYARVFMVD